MAIDSTRLQGEVIQDPEGPNAQDKDVERLLFGLLHALLQEQQIEQKFGNVTPSGVKE